MFKLSLPLSILVAGALIAAGLYFGLRHSGVQSPPPPDLPQGHPPAVADDGIPARNSKPAPLPEVQRAAEAALAALKQETFVPRCWAPIVAAAPNPGESTYGFHVVFSAEGIELARGISELRDMASRPDVANCLREIPLGLRIPVPGATVSVETQLSFP